MPILGTPESVRGITSDELHRFVGEKFRPERMAFTVVADIDEKKMEALILRLAEKFFPDAPAVVPGGVAVPSRTRLENVFSETIGRKNHEANAVIGGYAPSLYEDKERMAAILLSNILGGPASNSVLNSVLREKNGWV